MYRDFLEEANSPYRIYLAVSDAVYYESFTQKAVQYLVKRHQLALLLVNVIEEEVVAWID